VLIRFRFVIAAALVTTVGFARTPACPSDVTVHEWGTFTSVAGEDGHAIEWMPLDGPIDLPCFVERSYPVSPKGALFARVRMETPVLYFYSPRNAAVDVRVGFKQGLISEYFPSAKVEPGSFAPSRLIEQGFESAISWRGVRILPQAAPEFLTESAPNHYYAARATDAAPIEVGADRERFLFYRGVGNFALPITATIAHGNDIVVRTEGNGIPSLMLFENRGGRIGLRVQDAPAPRVLLSRPELEEDEEGVDGVRAALQGMLEAQGLYPREARAMIETWRDSWFTEGARILYVVPQETIDAVLPLSIDPAPARIVRAFVGRLELATEATLSDIRTAALAGDKAAMLKYGRFLRPFADRLLAGTAISAEKAGLRARLERVTSAFGPAASTCR